MRCKGAIDVSMKLSEAPQSKKVEMGKEHSKGTEMGNKNEEALDERKKLCAAQRKRRAPFCTPTGSPAGFPGQAAGVRELGVLLEDREP